jgi:hypothetical protein
MPSILDAARPLKAECETTKGMIDVQGVPNEVWAMLYEKHPALIKIVNGEAAAVLPEGAKPDVGMVLERLDAMTALVGASTALADGADPQSKPHGDAAGMMTMEDLGALIAKIQQISFPGEIFRPLRAVLNRPEGPDGRASDTKS